MDEEFCRSTEGATENCASNEDFHSTPPADIYETAQDVVVLLDMPGVKSEDLELELDGNSLTITGKSGQLEQGGRIILTEYGRSNYFRSFYVGDMVDRAGIDAELADGVLKIVLPKAVATISRRIPISEDPS
jgi:HSP20 family molecular chaperone IbpA